MRLFCFLKRVSRCDLRAAETEPEDYEENTATSHQVGGELSTSQYHEENRATNHHTDHGHSDSPTFSRLLVHARQELALWLGQLGNGPLLERISPAARICM